jgi:hypothetical protein
VTVRRLWCDIHHREEWDRNDGDTALHNGAPLCRRHHSFIRTEGWTVLIDSSGHPRFIRPDGTIHTASSSTQSDVGATPG